mgnify:FL=1
MENQQKPVNTLRDDVVTAAVKLFEGDQRAAKTWLNQPLRAIGDKVPALYMDSPEKIQEVRDIIGRLEHGVWTEVGHLSWNDRTFYNNGQTPKPVRLLHDVPAVHLNCTCSAPGSSTIDARESARYSAGALEVHVILSSWPRTLIVIAEAPLLPSSYSPK